MHLSARILPFFCFAALVRAQTAPSASDAPTIHLDRYVVTSGLEGKTAFDLAQGTSVLTGAELLRRSAGTLGETLDSTAGVNTTYYGPGASRPIIRGLGGDRVRVLQDGVGAFDASNISPDHNTALEPFTAKSIEVLRGPATLLYGSSAVGGVVNVISNEIPEEAPAQPVSGSLEFRGFGAADESTGNASILAGTSRVAVQTDLFAQRTGDIRIPGVARIDAAAPADQPVGHAPNSDTRTTSASVGTTWFGSAGHLGAAVSDYQTKYGVPVDEPISISMRRQRLDLSGALTREFGIFTGARARFGVGDYTHSEIQDHATINTTFRNKAWEGRLELPHTITPELKGTVGVQAERSDFSAVGSEVVTPPSVTDREAVFAVEEWRRGMIAFQAGARLERQAVKLGNVPEGLPPVAGYSAASGENRTKTGTSESVGVVFYPAKDWSAGLSLAYTERLPTAQELFSNGPHGGTAAWEIGTSNLGLEKSLGLDLSVRKRAGVVTGSVGAFVNRFRNYVFEQRLPDDVIPAALNDQGLTPYQFTAKNALFYGAEAELEIHVIDAKDYGVHLQLSSDYVHAEQTDDHEPLPRTPPLRLGAGLRYDSAHWRGGIGLKHVTRQNRVAPLETPTSGYTLVDADLSYAFPFGKCTWEIFTRGTNLTNQEARVHTSFIKDFVPLPGRGVVAGVRLTF